MQENQMIKYGCGHENEIIILDNNPLSMAAYLEWEETTGDKGDKSECFDCFCKKNRQDKPTKQVKEKEAKRTGAIPWIIKFLLGIIIGAIVAVATQITTNNLVYTFIAAGIAVFATRLALDLIG